MTVINTNISALRAQSGAKMAESSLAKAMERLSTGKRINSAKDAAAGVAISQRMTRSEEHTSELQSLMRISYAVFCWKQTNADEQHNNYGPQLEGVTQYMLHHHH